MAGAVKGRVGFLNRRPGGRGCGGSRSLSARARSGMKPSGRSERSGAFPRVVLIPEVMPKGCEKVLQPLSSHPWQMGVGSG